MGLSNFSRFGVFVAGGLLLVQCTGASQPSVIPPAGGSTVQTPAGSSGAVQSRHRDSWMANGIGQRDLLYVSNGNGTVNVYTFWQRRLVGVLTNFTKPLGECTDPIGNVYIVDYEGGYTSGKVSEYAHGGKKPIKVLNDPSAPYGCAVSPPSGDLAVANAPYGRYSSGDIAIYPHAKGPPKLLSGAYYNDQFNSVAYDDRGDLFTTSREGYLNFYTAFYYKPRLASKLNLINLQPPSGSGWGYVEGVAFDGKYWLVLSDGVIYQYTINVKAQLIGSITLYGAGGYGNGGPMTLYRKSPSARATQVLSTYANSTPQKYLVEYWYYPAGGNAYATISKYLDAPYGTAISLAPQ